MTQQNGAYLDFNATTPPDDEVVRQVPAWLKVWGNPSSIHSYGRGPKQLLREARENLAKLLGVQALELVFTSGGSESNSMVIRGIWNRVKNTSRKKFLISAVEHASLKAGMAAIEAEGAIIRLIPIDANGAPDFEFISRELDETVALVSFMLANNETGVLSPIQEIAARAHVVGALMHSDCVQGLGKVAIDLKMLDVDFASFSSHKFYALRGCGLLYIKKGTELPALVSGGGQERARRGGTENILAIASLGLMASKREEIKAYGLVMGRLRDQMESDLLKLVPGLEVVGQNSIRVPNTSCFIVPGIDGETLLMNLDLLGIAVSTGAACSAGNPEPSPVLLAMGYTRSKAQSSIRVSLGWTTTEADIKRFVSGLCEVLNRLQSLREKEGPHVEL